jgi:hypothetical protein
MTVKHTHQLRSALANAPQATLSDHYPTYYIGAKTREALMSLVDHVELAHRELVRWGDGVEPDPIITAALKELDDFLA